MTVPRLSSIVAVARQAAAAGASDALLIAGASAVSYGAWLIYAPAGFIVGGLFLLAGGVLVAKGRS